MSYDFSSVYEFLLHTPENGLRKMLVDQKPMTDVHFNILLKIVRGCNGGQFASHAESGDFPKMKFSPNELKLKEKFWSDVISTLKSRGLLSDSLKTAA